MKPRILVADDSLTVQKVINITLANHSYELVECLDEASLKEQLMLGKADLLLLDLNLSEGKSGYDLVKEIKLTNENLSVILLLGTFDTLEEDRASEIGVSGHIVKPFESNSFIKKIQGTLEEQTEDNFQVISKDPESETLEVAKEDASSGAKIYNDSWVVDAPEQVDNSSEDWNSSVSEIASVKGDALANSLEGWGMSVPAPIGGEELFTVDNEMELPGIINPEGSGKVELIDDEPSSHFITTDNFNFDDVESTTETSISLAPNTRDVKEDMDRETDLVASIEDEASEDEFWAVDASDEIEKDDLSLSEVAKSLEATKEESSLKSDLELEDEVELENINFEPNFTVHEIENNLTQSMPKNENSQKLESSQEVVVDENEMINKIIEKLRPMLKELIEKECKDTIENVAWQIIPDLAENLIRSEIKEIRDSSN